MNIELSIIKTNDDSTKLYFFLFWVFLFAEQVTLATFYILICHTVSETCISDFFS